MPAAPPKRPFPAARLLLLLRALVGRDLSGAQLPRLATALRLLVTLPNPHPAPRNQPRGEGTFCQAAAPVARQVGCVGDGPRARARLSACMPVGTRIRARSHGVGDLHASSLGGVVLAALGLP